MAIVAGFLVLIFFSAPASLSQFSDLSLSDDFLSQALVGWLRRDVVDACCRVTYADPFRRYRREGFSTSEALTAGHLAASPPLMIDPYAFPLRHWITPFHYAIPLRESDTQTQSY